MSDPIPFPAAPVRVDQDRPWDPLHVDHDAFAHPGGDGPWIILVARWEEGSDPADILPMAVDAGRLSAALERVRDLDLQALSPDSPWRNRHVPTTVDGGPPLPGVIVYLDADGRPYRHMRTNEPDVVADLTAEEDCASVAARILATAASRT